MIPKILHIIWVGDESKRPDNCIETWVKHNPDWTVQVWGNEDLQTTEWVNARHMREMAKRELNGVADLMKWEILYYQGGFVVDADSICQRPLEDWLLEGEAFACWENEIDRPKLIAAGYVASVPENPFFGQIIQDINAEESVTHDMAWKTVGPLRLTTAYYKYRYANLTIWPSHLFIPQHFAGQSYDGGGRVFATQEWASTKGTYDTLYQRRIA
ncbi:MAG: glycosyltransferase family 32 protein [Aquabacterium sp.]